MGFTLTVLLCCFLADGQSSYARPEMLVEPIDLLKGSSQAILLDTRSLEEYKEGHIPGARHVNVAAWSKALGQDEAAWSKRLGALGIDTTSKVIVYGESISETARAWWMLRYWGIADVAMVHGGWRAWLKAGGKPSTVIPKVTPTQPKLARQPDRLADKEAILAGKVGQIIDTRTKAEYTGEKVLAKRGGAIPQAKHLDWAQTLNARTDRFKDAAELQKLFRQAGIDPNQSCTTYCQSGGRASVMAFVLELTTGKPARNYYRSWAEWGNDDKTPVVKPTKPVDKR